MVGKLKTILVSVMKVSGEEIVKVCTHACTQLWHGCLYKRLVLR